MFYKIHRKEIAAKQFSRQRFSPRPATFSPITGKYGPEKNPYFDTFHTENFQVGIECQLDKKEK